MTDPKFIIWSPGASLEKRFSSLLMLQAIKLGCLSKDRTYPEEGKLKGGLCLHSQTPD
jgi:hypothetical protein